jgi:predicted PurR-regulated permease PerM
LRNEPPPHFPEIEAAPAQEEPETGPPTLPSGVGKGRIALNGLFALAVFFALYLAADIVIPLVFALLFKLLLQPGVRQLQRVHVPEPLGALLMTGLLLGLLGGVGYLIAGPAVGWAQKAPQGLPRLEERLSFLRTPVEMLNQATEQIETFTRGRGETAPSVTVKEHEAVIGYVFSGTRDVLRGLGITLLMLFFLLASGDIFLRRLVEILPTLSDKKQAVAISHEIEENISTYLVTVTMMNALVGLATALAMWAIGLSDAILWGSIAFVLNYVVILGPLSGVGMFFIVGLLSFDTLWQAVLPPVAYLFIHLVEGEWVTPNILARRFTLNPVLVIGSLIFWDWMWGIPGALLAVPMLAVLKIVCDRIAPLAPLGHFIAG